MKKLILVVTFFSIATIVAYAQTYHMPSSKTDGGAIQSQQIMPTRNYNGTVYEPFSSVTPSEQSAVGASYSPSDTPGGPRRSKITGPDTPPADEFPVGEPWVMAAFALLFAGTLALRRRKTTTTIEINHNTTNLNNNTPMKNNIVNKTSLTLLLLLTLGVGQMRALDIYLDISAANWPADGATIKLYPGTGSDVTGTSVATNLYKFTVTSATGTMWFKRMSGSSTWNQGSVTYNSSYNLYKLTGWDAAACSNANVSTITKTNYIYFDNSVTGWSNSYKYFVIGHDYPSAYSKVYSLSAIDNTKLWYVAQSSDSWVDATYYGMCSPTSSWGNGDWGSSNIKNANKYAAPYKDKYDMNDGSSYLFTPASSSNNCALTIDYKDGYSALNYSQTVKKYTSTNGGSTYSAASINSGTVTITPYKLTGNGTVSNSSNTGTLDEASETSVSKDAVYTGEVTVTASANSGYTFVGWFTAASGGSAVSTDASYTYNAPKSTNTIYARFKNETTYTITIANSVNASTSTVSVGATPVQITAPDIDGYEFSSWSAMPAGVTKTSGELTDGSIYISATSAATVTANYTEVLTTDWKLKGGSAFGGTAWSTERAMTKKTGHSTESVAYYTADITSINNTGGTANHNFDFKLWDGSTDYGLSADGDCWWYGRSSGQQTMASPGKNIELRADALGEYEIKIDWTSGKKITVTFPTAYAVTFGKGTGGSTVYAKYNTVSFSTGTKVQSGKTVTFTQTASTGYQFKEWNTNSSGTGTRLSTSATYDHTVSSSNNVYAIFSPKQYTITLNDQDATTAVSPSTVNATYKSLTLSSAITNPLKTGYTFGGWFSAVGGGGYEVINTSGALQASKSGYTDATGWTKTSAATLYAKWTQVLTLDKNGGTTDGSLTVIYKKTATSSHTAATRTGYTLAGYYDASSGGNKIINADGTLVNYSASVSSYIRTDGSWGYNGTPTLYAQWTANSYDVTLKPNGATTGSDQVVRATYDAAMPTTTKTSTTLVAPTKTGYTLQGFYQNNDGTGTKYYNANMTSANNWNQAGNVNIYAKWTAKSYTVTLDYDETNHGDITSTPPTNSVTTTYDAEMPAIAILPKATEGYSFMGYYSAAGGSGTQYYDGTGASVTNWDVDDNVTLYAYYKKAEITVGLAAAVVAPWTEESPSTVTATPTISPTPAGNTKICWFLLQNNNNPVEPQPTFTPGEGNSVSFPAPAVSGNYKVVATLRTGTSCDGGTLLDADTVIFTVAGEHTVTILYKCGDDVIKASTTSPGKPLEGTSITAPNIIGYSFHHWVLGDGVTLASGTAGSAGSAGTATISYTAIYDGQITAVYTKKRLIYFNNTLGWSNVYVYFYKNANYWDNSNGTGSNTSSYSSSYTGIHGQMLPVSEGSQIYYFDAEAAGVNASYQDVAFTELEQTNYNYFAKTVNVKNKVIRRGDYKATTLPMFVPLAGVAAVNKNGNLAEYYNEGYWMNYPENTGYVLKIYDSKTYGTSDEIQSIPFEFTADKTMPMSLTVELNANREYGFEIHRADGSSYGNNSKVMKINDSGDNGSPWAATSGKRTGLKTSVAGEYIFTLSFGNNGGYNYLVGVHYPVAANDYRIVYNDRVKWSHNTAHNEDWHHPSRAIHKENGAKDTVSFYVSKAAGASASMKFQYARSISGEGVVTWSDVASGSIDLSSIENSGVYNFILTQSAGSISVEKIEPYTGAYYIRTDCAGSTKWDNYRAADHQMTYSEFSKSRETNKFGDLFSHYFTKWCPRGTNIKFCIANDYSSCVSDTLIEDDAFDGSISDFENVDVNGTLKNHGEGDATADPYSANIRFMYDESHNRIKRAYVAASTNVTKRFLVLQGDDKLKDKNGNAIPVTTNLEENAVLFQDDQNWIYETTVKAIPGARIRIYANYLVGLTEQATQFFCGASGDWDEAHTVELLGGSGSTPMLVRVIYDFKTNRLVCAWMPDGTDIDGEHAINADIMVVREHQDAAQTITFANDESKLSKVKTVYGAMKFNRWILNNRQHPEDVNPDHCRAANIESDLSTYHRVLPPAEQKSIYERSLYFISFPFRVKLSEVFGFGKYWDEWYIEYYDGETRAKNGYWKDSPPNWKYVTTDMLNSFYLEPNVGYILGLDLDYMQAENTTFWANGISNVELYFPSQESIETIGRTAVKMPALGDAYLCTINRGTSEGDRRVKDSYWRCIGVPGYSSYNNTLTVDGSNEFSWQTNTAWREDFKDYPFLYEWNMTDNTLTAQSTNRYNFKAMHAYLVQNGNEIHWSAISATPVSPIVARNRAASQTEYLWRLTMECDGQEEDQAFIRMTDEEAVTDGFDFGQDLVKEYNYQRSDLYTYIGYERAAANSMPLHTEETTSIPVGVSIEKGGEYTFAMPDGTSGVGIMLIDSETGAQTNLSAGFTYTVNFEKGDYNNRLYLEISPVSQISTGVDEVPSDHVQGTKARKVVIDGLLYIVKEGQMYDATGKHCK